LPFLFSRSIDLKQALAFFPQPSFPNRDEESGNALFYKTLSLFVESGDKGSEGY
jgi:hypothetical protein